MSESPAKRLQAAGPSPVGLIVRVTTLDFLRRKDLYVVAILMALYVIGAVVVRVIRIPDAETGRFLMSAGLALSQVLAAILAASFCARVFPEEFEQGTLMPLLAKPVSRAQVLTGKWLACLGLSLGSYLLFAAATLLTIPLTAGQEASALVQVVLLQMTSLSMLGAATLALSLEFPALLSALVALTWYFGAGFVLTNTREVFHTFGEVPGAVAGRLLYCVPDPSLLSHTECFAGGVGNLGAGLFGALVAYGAAWTAAILLLAIWRFGRMRL